MQITPITCTPYYAQNNYHTNFKSKQSMTVIKSGINNLSPKQKMSTTKLLAAILAIIGIKEISNKDGVKQKDFIENIKHQVFLKRVDKLVPANAEQKTNYKATRRLITKTSDTEDLNYILHKLQARKTSSENEFYAEKDLIIMIAEKTAPQFRKDFVDSIPEKYREIAKEVVADKNTLYHGGSTHNSDNTYYNAINALKLDIMEKCGYCLDYECHGRYITTSSLTDFTLNKKRLNPDMTKKVSSLNEWLCVDKLWNWFIDDNKDITSITQQN